MPRMGRRRLSCYIGLTLALCGLALSLILGTAQGRYRYKTSSDDGTVQFYMPDTQMLCLNAVSDEGAGGISFQITNGTADSVAGEAQSYRIRIVTSLGIADASNLTLTLRYGDRTYIGQAEPILEGSGRYETFGPGWVYCFYEASGAEAVWKLAGGTLSAADYQLTLEGSATYTSLLRVEVTGI